MGGGLYSNNEVAGPLLFVLWLSYCHLTGIALANCMYCVA